jgi:hypothetical protein
MDENWPEKIVVMPDAKDVAELPPRYGIYNL